MVACFDAAAKEFGWSKRNPQPGSTRDGDWLIGWGCATSMYPTQMGPASARVILTPQGSVRVQTAGHEIGTGIITVLALMAVSNLGVAIDKVAVEVGDPVPAPQLRRPERRIGYPRDRVDDPVHVQQEDRTIGRRRRHGVSL